MEKPATLRLSVLDQSPIREGGTPADALNETIELAKFVERLGFHRYWLAEHHSTEGLAGPAPEIMVTRIAAETTAIRVGSGGVMLPHYSPYKVAESFRVLETLYPGRIDLGIGRAPGSDQITAAALAFSSAPPPAAGTMAVAPLPPVWIAASRTSGPIGGSLPKRFWLGLRRCGRYRGTGNS